MSANMTATEQPSKIVQISVSSWADPVATKRSHCSYRFVGRAAPGDEVRGDIGAGGGRERRAGESGCKARDDLDADTFPADGFEFLPSWSEEERVATLQAYDVGTGPCVLDEEVLDPGLAGAVPLSFTYRNPLGGDRSQIEQGRIDEAVIHHDIGCGQRGGTAYGDHIGAAWPSTHKGHAARS